MESIKVTSNGPQISKGKRNARCRDICFRGTIDTQFRAPKVDSSLILSCLDVLDREDDGRTHNWRLVM